MPQIGLSNFVYSILQKDDSTGIAYSAPVAVPNITEANIKPKTESATLYADDGPVETASALGEIDVDITLADLDIATQAALLGHTASGGVLIKKSTDIAPYVAIGFKSSKSNGKYRYVWLLKGKFEPQEQANKTKEDKINFQTPKLTAKFVKRANDNAWQKVADEDDPNYVSSIGQNWFTAVEASDGTAPTVSSVVPANNATAVAATSVITWTFSEALQSSSVVPANFAVIKDTDGTNVAGTLSLNAARTVVTFTPSANLTAATAYRSIVTTGVKDLYGNSLATPYVTKFTTA